ncbi:MAG: von Willebrand factor type A domain-containing protein, partial [Clostridia bacterium]|nr:von Willebrand factor type A domain-containing protein [Clostridia bacterium]
MRKKYVVFALILTIITAMTLCAFTACAGAPKNDGEGWFPPIAGTPGDNGSAFYPEDSSNSTHEPGFDNYEIKENPVVDTNIQNDLYFSVDTHTAGYTQLKNLILNERYYGSLANYVKIDQMLNYFHYDYSTPQNDDLLAINASTFDCPYNSQKKLLRIGLTSKEVELTSAQNNIVLLLDVSGSMSGASKIELMKKAMIMAVENLNPDDKISIVTYSDRTRVV